MEILRAGIYDTMDKENIAELVEKLLEVMVDPLRDPSLAGATGATVEDRNRVRKEAADHIKSCVEYLASYIDYMEMGEELAEVHEKYAPGNIDDAKAAK